MNIIALLLCVFLPGLPEEVTVCGFQPPTVRQMVNNDYDVVVAKWVSVEKPIPRQTVGRTTYRVIEVVHDSQGSLNGKTEVVIERYWPGEPGGLFLLYNTRTQKGKWNPPISITRSSLPYIKQVAALGPRKTKQLEFFQGYLEHVVPFVAYDAYREFDDASFEDIQAISSKLPRKKLTQRVKSECQGGKCESPRLGLYSLLLGLCGDDEDAALLADYIKKPAKEYRSGTQGVFCGYLLLRGEKGLKLLDDSKFKAVAKSPPGETYAAMRALEFAWRHTDIRKDRLKQSMRLLIAHPDYAPFALHYLRWWKDWSVQDQLMTLYGQNGFDKPTIKRHIVTYLLASRKDSTDDGNGNLSKQHAKEADKHLGFLRKTDPDTVKRAEFYFNLK